MAGGAFIGAARAAGIFTKEIRTAAAVAGTFQQSMDDLRRSTAGFRQLTDGISGVIDEMRRQVAFTGGTAAQIGGIGATLRSIGLSPEAMAPIADSFRERLFRDPIAIGAFGRSVVTPRLGGPQNSAQILDEAITMLRGITDAEDRLRTARRLGLEVMLPIVDADEKHYQAMRREGEIKGAMVNEDMRGLRAVQQTQKTRLEDLRQERAMVIERAHLRIGNWFRDNIQIPVEQFFTHRLPGVNPAGQRTNGRQQDQQANALDRNTVALNTLRREFANAGPRAAGAMPAGLRGDALQKALDAHSIRLGAFAL